MIVEPEKYLPEFAARGADMLTVHVEACPHLQRTLVSIRELAGKRGAPVKAGAALNPATHPSTLDYVTDDLDLVLVMSVNPGFGGQAFIPAVYPKIRQIRSLLGSRAVDVSIDGGVKVEHARPLAEHGASILVAGSAVFDAKDPAAVIKQMRAGRRRLTSESSTRVCRCPKGVMAISRLLRVAELWRYPVKSLAGERLDACRGHAQRHRRRPDRARARRPRGRVISATHPSSPAGPARHARRRTASR